MRTKKDTLFDGGNWVNDPAAESVMEKLGVKWEIADIPLKEIDFKATEQNPARSARAIIAENVDDYAVALLDNAPFPMPIAYEDGKKYVIISGVHRTLASREAGLDSMTCYVVRNLLPHSLRALSIKANMVVGQKASREELLEYAIDLVLRDGLLIKDAADLMGIKVGVLGQHVRSRQVAALAEAAGFRKKLPMSTWAELLRLKNNQPVLVATAAMIQKHKLNIKQIQEAMRKILAAESESKQLAVVREIEKSYERINGVSGAPDGRVIRLPKRQTFTAAWTNLHNKLVNAKSLADLQITQDDPIIADLKEQGKAIIQAISRLLK